MGKSEQNISFKQEVCVPLHQNNKIYNFSLEHALILYGDKEQREESMHKVSKSVEQQFGKKHKFFTQTFRLDVNINKRHHHREYIVDCCGEAKYLKENGKCPSCNQNFIKGFDIWCYRCKDFKPNKIVFLEKEDVVIEPNGTYKITPFNEYSALCCGCDSEIAVILDYWTPG